MVKFWFLMNCPFKGTVSSEVLFRNYSVRPFPLDAATSTSAFCKYVCIHLSRSPSLRIISGQVNMNVHGIKTSQIDVSLSKMWHGRHTAPQCAVPHLLAQCRPCSKHNSGHSTSSLLLTSEGGGTWLGGAGKGGRGGDSGGNQETECNFVVKD